MSLHHFPVRPSYTSMHPRSLSFPPATSDSSPALRLPRDISNISDSQLSITVAAVTNFSHPFEADFSSSPFVIPDFHIHSNQPQTGSEGSTTRRGNMSLTADTTFRPASSIYSMPGEAKSEEVIESKSPSSSVFNNGGHRSSNPIQGQASTILGQALTTSASEDQILHRNTTISNTNATPNRAKHIDVVEAANSIYQQGPGLGSCHGRMTALPSFSQNPNVRAKDEGNHKIDKTIISGEDSKTKKTKRGGLFRLGKSISATFSFGRKRKVGIKNPGASDTPGVRQGATNDDPEPESSFLTPITLPSTIAYAEAAGPKRISTGKLIKSQLLKPKRKGWTTKKLKRAVKGQKVEKMAFQISKLKEKVEKLEEENETLQAEQERLKAENRQLRADWYAAEDTLTNERYQHFEENTAREQAALAAQSAGAAVGAGVRESWYTVEVIREV